MSAGLPQFSVVVPTYERPARLSSCVRALSQLDYPRERFEVLIVDDGSARPPLEIIERFRGALDVKLFEQAKNAGPAAARNLGARRARGEFLAFTDDDCEPERGWLRAFATRFAGAPARIVGGRTVNALAHNPYSETSQLIIEVVYAHFNRDAEDARFFASNNFAAHAESFREAGGFDETFRTSEDREICARWRSRGLGMTYEPRAVVLHSHRLTLGSLWRQHFGYGRGALRFHRAREGAGDGPFKPDADFYTKLLRAALSQTPRAKAAQLTALLLWSQAANAAGFFYEKFRKA
ncbi:MAG TPA: glycosyltransferase [Pyrinomonadaceae bacterium]|nr:glycosyltransferase [Pyrinomonadaceae bacterium]